MGEHTRPMVAILRFRHRAHRAARGCLGAGVLALGLTVASCTGETPRGSQSHSSDETAAGPSYSSIVPIPVVTSTPAASSFERDVASIQKTMDAAIRGKVVPGIVVLVRRGPHVRLLARGQANVADRVPMTARDRFRIGSITKPMVAVIALKLVERDVLSLDDTVEQWLPGLVRNGGDTTIEELLNHSSGLPDYVDSPRFLPLLNGPPVSPRQLVRMATAQPEIFRPGQGSSYTNTGYVLLGMIIERATHQPLATNLRSTVFEPAGMNTSSLAPAGANIEPVAHGYEKGRDVTTPQLTWAWAAGAVVSDARDLATFFDRLLNGHLLRADLLSRMQDPNGTPMPDIGYDRYGLGLAELETPCGTAWGHEGRLPGFVSAAWLDNTVNRQVVVFVNVTNDQLGDTFESVINTALCGTE